MPELADCSVVTLAHNGRRFTEYCLDAVLAAAVLPRQFIMVNNGSTDDTAELIEQAAPRFAAAGVDFVSWRNSDNLGCSEARNQAWEKATAKYVVFMDNDVAVASSDWLARLTAMMDADEALGVLGVKLLYPYRPHPIQCAGVGINPLGRIRFRGRGAARDDSAHGRTEDVPALISACWIMPNRLLSEIGGLDPLFHPVQYEDLDFCLRAVQAGYRCVYTPEVEMYHFEGMTTASFGQADYARNIVEQSAKFRQRWREVLKAFPPDDGDFRWRDRNEFGMTNELDLSMV